jgi:hypothetical protein
MILSQRFEIAGFLERLISKAWIYVNHAKELLMQYLQHAGNFANEFGCKILLVTAHCPLPFESEHQSRDSQSEFPR